MKRWCRHSFIVLAATLALLGGPRAASAACTSPAGVGGTITWNESDSVIWCDGTTWYRLKDAASGGSAAGSTGQIQFNNGSNAFAADSALTWDNTNKRLGIGTATPGSPLSIKSASASSYAVMVLASTGSGRMFVQEESDNSIDLALLDSAGNAGVSFQSSGPSYFNGGSVGIGTSSPSYLLSLGGEAARTIGMERTTAGTNGLGLTILAGGAKSATADLNGGDLVLSSGTATGTGSSNISFKTSTAAATGSSDNAPTTKMTILGNGNVGIGTASPTSVLHISGNAAALSGLSLMNTNTTPGTTNDLTFTQGTGAPAGIRHLAVSPGGNHKAYLQFFTNDAGTKAVRMAIDDVGNVGIATTTPGFRLDVMAHTMRVGGDWSGAGTARTDATTKRGYLVTPHYLNAEKSIAVIAGMGGATDNDIYIGGNTSNYNAATSIQFFTAPNNTTTLGYERMRIAPSGYVGLGTWAPSYPLSLNGEAARTIGMERAVTGTNGYELTLLAGGAKSATADLNGGDLVLSSGIATGTGSSNISFKTATAQGSTASTNNTPSTKMTILGNGNVGVGTTAPQRLLNVSAANAATDPTTTTSDAAIGITNPNTTANNFAELGFLTNDSSASVVGGARIAGIFTSHTAGAVSADLAFLTRNAGTWSEKMRIMSAGNVLIGRTTTSSASTPAALTIQHTYGVNYGLVLVSDNTGASSVVRFDNPNGNVGSIVVTDAGTAYATTSDRRLKENISDTKGALGRVLRIPVHDFSFRSDPTHKLQTGFIAQELQQVLPEAVITNGDDGVAPLKDGATAWNVDYGRVTPLLVRGMQELKAANDNLVEANEALQAANDDLRALVEAQGRQIEAQGRDIEALKAAAH